MVPGQVIIHGRHQHIDYSSARIAHEPGAIVTVSHCHLVCQFFSTVHPCLVFSWKSFLRSQRFFHASHGVASGNSQHHHIRVLSTREPAVAISRYLQTRLPDRRVSTASCCGRRRRRRRRSSPAGARPPGSGRRGRGSSSSRWGRGRCGGGGGFRRVCLFRIWSTGSRWGVRVCRYTAVRGLRQWGNWGGPTGKMDKRTQKSSMAIAHL